MQTCKQSLSPQARPRMHLQEGHRSLSLEVLTTAHSQPPFAPDEREQSDAAKRSPVRAAHANPRASPTCRQGRVGPCAGAGAGSGGGALCGRSLVQGGALWGRACGVGPCAGAGRGRGPVLPPSSLGWVGNQGRQREHQPGPAGRCWSGHTFAEPTSCGIEVMTGQQDGQLRPQDLAIRDVISHLPRSS